MKKRLAFLALALMATACGKPPETFEAEGIRLHDAAKACEAELVPGLTAGDAPLTKPGAYAVFAKRCNPIWEADKAHIAKAKELREAGIIR
jgi:hypothetical protein